MVSTADKEMLFHVNFLGNAKLETHTKDDYCFIVIPELCFHCMPETGDEASDVPVD